MLRLESTRTRPFRHRTASISIVCAWTCAVTRLSQHKMGEEKGEKKTPVRVGGVVARSSSFERPSFSAWQVYLFLLFLSREIACTPTTWNDDTEKELDIVDRPDTDGQKYETSLKKK